MLSLIRKLSKKKLYPVLWTLLTIVLLCLPGSALPSGGLFNIKHLDKVAHVVLFGGIVLLWGYYFLQHETISARWMPLLIAVAVANVMFGVGMEFFQQRFIPNRSFDTGDIWADAAGTVAVLSYILVAEKAVGKKRTKPVIYKKSKPL